MQARGLARGVSLPSTADFAYVLEGRAPANTAEPEDDGGMDEGEADLDEESEAFEDEDE